MKNRFLLFFITLTSSLIAQTGQLSGQVYLDNQLILGASVQVTNTTLGTTTNENGSFSLNKIPIGENQIKFDYVGAKSVYKTVTIIADSNKTITVNLEPSSTLREVVISVPGSKLQKDLVVNVEKKKLGDIYKASSSTLAESIANINGVSQNSTGNSIGKPVIRGLTSNRVVTYAQGIRLENQQWGAEHGLGVSTTGVKSVEVIKGPASLLYGSDAIGGVLYFIDEDFTDKNIEGGVETGYFTNAQTSQSRLGVKTHINEIKVNAFLGFTSSGDYKVSEKANTPELGVFNSRFQETSAKITLGLDKEVFSSKLTYNYLKNFFGIPIPDNPAFTGDFNRNFTYPFQSVTSTENFVLPFQDVTQHTLAFENSFRINETDLSLTLGYAVNDRQEFNEVENEADLYLYLNVLSYNLKAANVFKTNSIDVTFGAQGLYQDTENRGTVFLIPDGQSLENGVYGLFNLKVNENLGFQTGLRFDNKRIQASSVEIDGEVNFANFDESYSTLNYSVGAKYNLGDFLVRFNIASGYRAPNASELLSNGEHGGVGRIEVGDQNLDSESATQFDLAINYKNDKGLELSINPFYNKINNYIFISPTGERGEGDLPIFAYLQQDATLFGGEFNLNYQPVFVPKLVFQTGTAFTYGNDIDNEPLPLIPPVNFNSKISYDLNLGKIFKLNSLYIQQQNFLEQNRISLGEFKNDDYHLVNVGINASYKGFDLNFTVKNLFNESYVDHLSRLKTTFEDFVIPNPGRDFILNLKYNF